MTIAIAQADYENQEHRMLIPMLLNEYACDPMGGGEPLKPSVRDALVDELVKVPGAITLLAFNDSEPVGLMNSFIGFSTFAAKPLINIHDVYVRQQWRGQGVSSLMLQRIEQIARELNCCKLTLEVLSNNRSAMKSYIKFGFSDYQLDPETGNALFWQKALT
ncbi:MAG: GNAT family N-acetyltransferase [Pseudomonadales bacterium]|nr:GNAT family N-acetyltransferase [Pseudomonadales bacterium]